MSDVLKGVLVFFFAVLLFSAVYGCGRHHDHNYYIQGVKGEPGQSCRVEDTPEGVIIVCPEGSYEVADGQDGEDGEDGDFEGDIDIVEVCPDVQGEHKEVLLYLNGEYMAILVNADYHKERLTLLKENTTYVTSDTRNVSFQIQNQTIVCL